MGRELWGRTGHTGERWQCEPFPVPCWDRWGKESRRSWLYKITGQRQRSHLPPLGCPSLGPYTLLEVPAWVVAWALILVPASPSPWGLGTALSLHCRSSHNFCFHGLRLFSFPAPSLQSSEHGTLACRPLHCRSSLTDVVLHQQLSGEPGCNAVVVQAVLWS